MFKAVKFFGGVAALASAALLASVPANAALVKGGLSTVGGDTIKPWHLDQTATGGDTIKPWHLDQTATGGDTIKPWHLDQTATGGDTIKPWTRTA